MGRKEKKAKHVPSISPEKTAKHGVEPDDFMKAKPSWRLNLARDDGEWPWREMDRADAIRVRKFLCDLETMTWREIIGHKHHPIGIDELCSDAQRELARRRMEDLAFGLNLQFVNLDLVVHKV